MKRRLAKGGTPAEQTSPAEWQGTLSDTLATWRERPRDRELSTALVAAGGAALIALLIATPAYLSGLGLASVTAFFNGLDPFPFEVLTDPLLWLPLLAIAAIVGGILFILFARARITAFSFDCSSGQLCFEETRLLFPSKARALALQSIIEIRPIAMTSDAQEGHFEVTITRPRGRTRTLWLGDAIPLAELDRHAEWLRAQLGDRVRPLVRHDC